MLSKCLCEEYVQAHCAKILRLPTYDLVTRQSAVEAAFVSLACLEQDAMTRREEILLADNTKKYEVLYIVRPNLDEEAVDRTVATVEEHMKTLGCNIESTEKKGRRRLAYEVKKMRDGYYVLTLFTAPPATITPLNRYLVLNEDLIRHIVVVREEEAVVQ